MIFFKDNTNPLKLIDRILVRVYLKSADNELFNERESGIYVPNPDSSERAFNFGKLLALPYAITEDKYEELARNLKINMTVFFSASKSYNYIELESQSENHKHLMIPLYDIDAYYDPADTANYA